MSAMVFKIQQNDPTTLGKEDQISQDTLGKTQTLPEGAIANEEQTASDSVYTAGAAGGSGEGSGAVGDASVGTTKVEPTVKVDGPIGRIFTTALNKLLAVEGYMTMPTEEIVGDIVKQEAEAHVSPMIEVFCWRTDAVNTEEIVQLTNAITKHKERTFVVALESAGRMSKSLGILEDLGKIDNVKLCYSVERAASVVAEKIRG